MSNVQSYNALIDRFKAFASGHFILKTFSHGQIDTADLEKFTEYPFMHVVPSNVTYAKGTKTFSFQIVLADLPRDKDDKVEFQKEVLSDLQRIAEDLVAEITNHRVLFGDLITVQNVTLEPFLEEFHNTLTGWTVSLELLVPYYWDACSIPAEWNDFFESGSGGTGSILTFIDSITRDENGNVSLVNDEATPAANYYYGTNDEGVRGWYLLEASGLTCETIGSCQTIIDIEAAIDLLQEDVTAIEAELPNKVPYTGATQDVNLGEYELKAGQLTLDTSPTGTAAVGTTRWNNTIGSSETTLKGGSVILKNGVDLVARVVNKVTPNTTLTKAAYQAVRVSGAQGQRLAVAFAQANNDNNSADTIGLVTETIATNQEGFILTVGQLEGINTTGSLQGETWADGDVLYLSPTTAGRLTNIKPTGATGHIVVIGYVEYAHANNGKIYVKIMNGWELDELHNVSITTPANNDILQYQSSTSLWKNNPVTYMWTVDFLEHQTATFIAPYACSINSVANVQNSPTITITKNGSAYTLGTSIALGDDLVISANIASVVNLNISQL
jgi:nitrogen fixation protein